MKYKVSCPKCKTESSRSSKSIIKKGYYTANSQKTPRYFCKACSTYFSNRSTRLKGQKRPELNQRIYDLYSSGLTINRLAIVLKCSKNTIKSKITWLSELIETYHQKLILSGAFISNIILFDEMETYEHTKLKPLSVPLAVNGEGKVIDIKVASMKAKGHISKKSVERYFRKLWI